MSETRIDPITKFINTLRIYTSKSFTISFVILLTVMIRLIVGFGSYSGYNDPPKYGDFEA